MGAPGLKHPQGKLKIFRIHYHIGETDLANYPVNIGVCTLEESKVSFMSCFLPPITAISVDFFECNLPIRGI